MCACAHRREDFGKESRKRVNKNEKDMGQGRKKSMTTHTHKTHTSLTRFEPWVHWETSWASNCYFSSGLAKEEMEKHCFCRPYADTLTLL